MRALLLCYKTYYDIIMGDDVAKDAQVWHHSGNDVVWEKQEQVRGDHVHCFWLGYLFILKTVLKLTR